MTVEIVIMWMAVTLYALAAVLDTVGLVFRKDPPLKAALWVAAGGLAVHAGAIGVRWARTGHGPALGFYEVVSSFAWVAVAGFLLLVWRYPKLRPMGILIMPIAFLTLAAAMFTPMSDLVMTSRLASYWLMIHVALAKLAYGSFLISFTVSIAYLFKDKEQTRSAGPSSGPPGFLASLPEPDVMDELAFRFVSIGFIFLSMMIIAGAIWANQAWGRYWGWDPIETWSLISWLVYVGYLHLRLTMGWRGRRAARYAIFALPVLLFALVGVPIVYNSIHAAYLTGAKPAP
jgi:cytochrome c-type biogenesis protein CcsB